MILSLADVLESLTVRRVGGDGTEERYVAAQLDNATHHIVGGHIAAQALVAASRTAPGRLPHSIHVLYLRAGDARHEVDFHVERTRDGGALSSRRIVARQGGDVLLEALASFASDDDRGADSDHHQTSMPEVPGPDALPAVAEQLRDYADELGGHWVRPQPFDLRYVDLPPRLAVERPEPSPRMRMWWRPSGSGGSAGPIPADPVLHDALLTYLSGTTMLETALAMRRATPVTAFSALISHALWFHRRVDLTDWVLSDQLSPSGFGGRGLATATMYNRSGELVCVATQELYFGRQRR